MISNPRHIDSYTRAMLIEEIIHLLGLCGQRRLDLELLSIEQLTAIRDEILREALIL